MFVGANILYQTVSFDELVWAPAHMSPSTVIVVGYERRYLATMFGDIQQAGAVTNSYGMRNEEYGNVIWMCRSPLVALDVAWPRLEALD